MVELSAENKRQLYVPRGFLHGFSVISESATFFINVIITIINYQKRGFIH